MRVYSLLILSFIFFISCQKPDDCIKSTGPLTSKSIDVSAFDKIVVYKGIGLVINQGSEYKVEVKTGENLINDIQVNLSDRVLSIQDNTTCNWVRDYGQTLVYITAPNLTDIYSKTEQNIISNGMLTYPNLRLTSMDFFDGYKGVGTGDFIFNINTDNLTIDSNNVSKFTINGQTANLNINVYEGNGIIDTKNLFSDSINIYHRGSNDIFVHPINSIFGNLYNVGNIIASSTPEIIEVTSHYSGKLIFD